MNYASQVMDGVYYLQLESKEIEYLTYPDSDFIWDQKLPLEEGDSFLMYAVNNLGRELLLEYFLQHNVYGLNVIYAVWLREVKGEITENLEEEVRQLREVVHKLVALHAEELVELMRDEELLAEVE